MPGKLIHFEVGGRGEAIRMLLAHCNFQYEDARQTFPQFGELKASGALPLDSMPVWEEDGFKMA